MLVIFLLKFQQDCINKWKYQAIKNRGLFLLMNQWTSVKQNGKEVKKYFIQNNINKIAIYGMGYVGIRLVKELRNSEIEVVYGIDKNAANIYSEIELRTVEDELSDVDAVIVTLIDGFDEVYSVLSKKMDCRIIAIEDVINEI